VDEKKGNNSMVQYPKINTYVHKTNSIPCQLGDDFVLSRPTMWMKKGNLSMVHSSRKKTHTCAPKKTTCKLSGVFSFLAPQCG